MGVTGPTGATGAAGSGSGSGGAPGTIYATPENFPGIDPTGATSSSTALAAFIAAIPDGGTGVIPPGLYQLTARLVIKDKSVRISAYGATFINNADSSASVLVHMQGGYETVYSVTTINRRYTAGYGKASETMWITDLTLSSPVPTGAAGWKRGEIIKIFSNDINPYADDSPPSYNRSGEGVVIADVQGSVVTVAGQLRDIYTISKNVRVSRFLQHEMVWEGGTFRAPDARLAEVANYVGMLMMESLVHPVVRDIRVESSTSTAFSLRACYGARMENCTVDYAQDARTTANTSATSKNGYGVTDSGQFSIINNFIAKRIRHAYTTAGALIADDSASPRDYGHTFGATISNSIAIGATQTGFDTHGDSEQITFSNCKTFDCYGGFLLRGINHKVLGGGVFRTTGFSNVEVNTASSSKYSFGSYIGGGLVIDGGAYSSNAGEGPCIYVQNTAQGAAEDTVEDRPTYVDDVIIRNRNTSEAIISANHATVRVGRIMVSDDVNPPATTLNFGVVLPWSPWTIAVADR